MKTMGDPGDARDPAGAPAAGYRRGVGVMLLDDRGLVFAARRIDFAEGAWQMPQGGIDPGETPREAASRELMEEIGTDKIAVLAESRRWLSYELPPELRRRAWGGRYTGQTQKWFACRFTGSDDDIDVDTETPEFSEWRWMELSLLTELIVPFKRRLYLDVAAEFGHLARPAARGRSRR